MTKRDLQEWRRRVVDVRGAAGVAWLDRLPTIIADCAARWSLTVLPSFEDLSYNYVAPAVRQDSTPVILKAGVPHPALRREIAALQHFDGDGMVRLLEVDPEQGVLLLERLLPGTPLADLPTDEQVTQVAAGLMRALWKPLPADHPFVTVAEWAADLDELRAHYDGGYGPFPRALVDRAQALFAEFLGAGHEPVLLHGDFHPENVLKSQRQPWLAIDPKGVVGPRLYDVATFVNSLPQLPVGQLSAFVERRVDQLTHELGFDREQVLGWALAQSVLAGGWSFENHGCGWEQSFAQAQLFDSLM